jgi:nitroimidazol reductase NimA-like FMN-containing flavoprotein (pyridoxamine 5'-phosphate oxidase superfamily)
MDGESAAPFDHAGLEVLGRDECDQLLRSTAVGRLAFVADGDVSILPVNYRMHGGTIVFRTTTGAKLDAAGRHAAVAFEIDGWDQTTQTGWSVLVKGIAVEVLDDETESELSDLGLRPWAPTAERRRWIRIRPDEITGRKIT